MQKTPNGFYMLMLPESTLEIVEKLSSHFGVTYPEAISMAINELSKQLPKKGNEK